MHSFFHCLIIIFLPRRLQLISAPTSHPRRDPLHQKHQLIPPHRAESDTLTQEYLRMESPLLQTLVVHGIPAAFPMQQLHQFAATAYKYIHISIGRVQANASHLTAQFINTGAHITRMLSHHKSIVFIQIKHGKTFRQQSSPKFCSPKSRLISDAYKVLLT